MVRRGRTLTTVTRNLLQISVTSNLGLVLVVLIYSAKWRIIIVYGQRYWSLTTNILGCFWKPPTWCWLYSYPDHLHPRRTCMFSYVRWLTKWSNCGMKVLWSKLLSCKMTSSCILPLLWTVNDFSTQSSLSGWSGQSYKACSTCNDNTLSVRY